MLYLIIKSAGIDEIFNLRDIAVVANRATFTASLMEAIYFNKEYKRKTIPGRFWRADNNSFLLSFQNSLEVESLAYELNERGDGSICKLENSFQTWDVIHPTILTIFHILSIRKRKNLPKYLSSADAIVRIIARQQFDCVRF